MASAASPAVACRRKFLGSAVTYYLGRHFACGPPCGRGPHAHRSQPPDALEPDLVEHKFYAKGVGPVLALTLSGGSSREELVGFVSG